MGKLAQFSRTYRPSSRRSGRMSSLWSWQQLKLKTPSKPSRKPYRRNLEYCCSTRLYDNIASSGASSPFIMSSVSSCSWGSNRPCWYEWRQKRSRNSKSSSKRQCVISSWVSIFTTDKMQMHIQKSTSKPGSRVALQRCTQRESLWQSSTCVID